MNDMKICYVWDEKLIYECDRLPAVIGRASLVHDLITAYSLLCTIKVVRSSAATYNDLREFHSELYLEHLKKFTDDCEEYITNSQDEEYGIGYDCPPVSNMLDFVCTIAGGSVTAAKCLLLGIADVSINWCGGWHHAHRFGAEGFCYVNDIVIAIEKLRKKFPKILYIDLDVHHGNGVQDAYSLSNSVFTLSFHKFEPGFYPGTGSIDDIGTHRGRGYTCNFPFHASYSDETMEIVFEKVFSSVYSCFSPDAIVVQCGADALAHDPHGGGALTTRSYCACVHTVLDKRKPTMLLGGGGYKHSNAARLWASLTAMVAGVTLDEQIPEHNHWPQYGPGYTIAIEPTLTKDTNKSSYIDDCITTITGNLQKYVGVQETIEPASKRIKIESNRINTNTQENDKPKEARCVSNNTSRSIYRKNAELDNNENNTTQTVEDVYAFVD